MLRVAKQMRKDKIDKDGPNSIKIDIGETNVEGTEVCGRWKEYFGALLNLENESELEVGKRLFMSLCMK